MEIVIALEIKDKKFVYNIHMENEVFVCVCIREFMLKRFL